VLTWIRDARGPLAVLAVALIWTEALVAAHIASTSPGVAVAALCDLSLTSALALYLIAVRRGHLPPWTIAVTVTAGLLVGRILLGQQAGAGTVVIAAAVGIDLMMLGFTVIRARRALRSWRASRGASRLERVAGALRAVGMPARLAHIVATEVALVSHAVTGWRTPVRAAGHFTVHRINGWPLFAGVLAFLIVVETAVVHVAIAALASSIVAWIATGLSLYSIVWLIGDIHALRHGGVTVTPAGLELDLSVRWSGILRWSAIASIEPGTLPDRKAPGVIDASILGANVIVELVSPVELVGLFGRRRSGTRIGLSIDDLDRFMATLAAHRGVRQATSERSERGQSPTSS
jgi:hypothetical protein